MTATRAIGPKYYCRRWHRQLHWPQHHRHHRLTNNQVFNILNLVWCQLRTSTVILLSSRRASDRKKSKTTWFVGRPMAPPEAHRAVGPLQRPGMVQDTTLRAQLMKSLCQRAQPAKRTLTTIGASYESTASALWPRQFGHRRFSPREPPRRIALRVNCTVDRGTQRIVLIIGSPLLKDNGQDFGTKECTSSFLGRMDEHVKHPALGSASCLPPIYGGYWAADKISSEDRAGQVGVRGACLSPPPSHGPAAGAFVSLARHRQCAVCLLEKSPSIRFGGARCDDGSCRCPQKLQPSKDPSAGTGNRCGRPCPCLQSITVTLARKSRVGLVSAALG